MQHQDTDTFRTVEIDVGGFLHKDKGSKFISYVFPLLNDRDVKGHIENLKKEHHTARHICFAWKLGLLNARYRVYDDGEPKNSAGQPIYGQIISKGLTNVLVVVVRYFGGTKLGIGGLVSAYRASAKMVLDKSMIIEKTIDAHYQLIFEYKEMNKVMRIMKENNLEIIENLMDLRCEFKVAVRKKNALRIERLFAELQGLKINKISQ